MRTTEDWPILQVPACTFTDDDAQFHSDLIYMRALRKEIVELAAETQFANPLPITLSDELDAAIDAVKAVTW